MSASEQSKQTSQSRPSNFGIQHYFFQPHTQKPKSAPPPSSTSVPNSASSSNSETVHNLYPSDSVHCISSPQNELNRHSPSANRFNPSSGWSQEGDRDDNASNNPTDKESQHFMEVDTEQPQPVLIGGAETVLKIQPTSSVFVAYHPLFGPHEDLILLELDEKLIPDVLDHKVSLRGQMDEDAVLCTQSKTYAVKFVGTSNTALLIPPSDQPLMRGSTQDRGEKDDEKKMIAPVIKVAPGVMELVEVAPRLDKLKVLLSENPYGFHENEMLETDELDGMGRNNTGLYRWDDLIDNIQASNEELRSGLQALSAVEIDGYWRLVEENYMDGMLNMLLNNSVLNDWSLSALNESEVGGVLQSDGFPHSLAHHCLQVYGSKVSEGIWRLDEKRVCVHFARGILRGGKMRMDNFMVEWMKKIPEGMQASFDMLEGEVLTEKLGIESWLYAFSVSSLPSSPAERFSMLFRERPKWEWKDLQPYIRDLSVPGLSAEGLLLKYTRRTQPTSDAEPVLSAR